MRCLTFVFVFNLISLTDSCTRQFPEFAPRARKRIRTYLKSCRRTKRTREQAGLDGVNARPAPPHLTSIQAEQLLAKACENESENAKRMRMGLEPISQPMPSVSTHSIVDVLSHSNSPVTPVSMSALFPNMSAVTLSPRWYLRKHLKLSTSRNSWPHCFRPRPHNRDLPL